MDSEMRSLTDLLHQISTGLISKVREMHRLAKGVLNPVLPKDPGATLTSPPEVAVTKWRKKTDSTKRDKSHWEHMSIAHRKLQKSSGSVSGSGTGSGSFPGSGSVSGSPWFYDCVTFAFLFESSRRYIGYRSLDRRMTLYSATVE
ncbi:hypothetical protein M9H77_04664 [Catharanthus roseus]|uniref:Uncharacterized protein n=1 Tax=Catharanthus roseus TaxID=4058 RepID=A0ACC0CER6_CATRO|nr:hypothetical protein M9H77_04664 [Catharanthus roseus]